MVKHVFKCGRLRLWKLMVDGAGIAYSFGEPDPGNEEDGMKTSPRVTVQFSDQYALDIKKDYRVTITIEPEETCNCKEESGGV